MWSIQKLLELFVLQTRVIWALMLREIHTRWGRENIGFLWVIGEPMLFCTGVTIVWSAIRPAHDHGIAVPAFVVTGYVPLTLWRHCLARAVKAFEANGALLFHRHVTPLDIITARVILEIVGTFAAGFLVASATIILGYMEIPKDPELMFIGCLFHIAYCYAFALLISALSEYSEIVEKSLAVVSYLSLPLSGAFTMQSWLPVTAQRILAWSPSVNDLEMIRGGQFGLDVHPQYDMLYTARAVTIMTIIGLSLCLRIRPRLIVQ